MRRVFACFLSLLLVLSLAACGTEEKESTSAAASTEAETKVIRVGMECAYAPSNWQEDTASDTNVPVQNVSGAYAEGYDVQIARIIADYGGYELQIFALSWDGLIEALNQGQIDMIIAGMADTAERREAINFSDPYHATEYGIIVQNDSVYASAKTIQDFAGASVLGQKDTKLDTVIDQMNGVNHLTPVSSVPNMISRLAEGTCDAIVVNVESSAAYLEQNPTFKLIRFASGDGFDLGFTGSCVGLRKSDTELLEMVNKALATVSEDTRAQMWQTAVDNQPK